MTLDQIKEVKLEAQRLLQRAEEAEVRVMQEVEHRNKFWGEKQEEEWINYDYSNMREIGALKRALQDVRYVGARINNPNLYK